LDASLDRGILGADVSFALETSAAIETPIPPSLIKDMWSISSIQFPQGGVSCYMKST
jgi:hypothetical protein